MLVVENNKNFVQWNTGSPLNPMDYSGEVIVVFDPSKSNMAMLVGTPDGTVLNTLEFSGNNRKKGPVMDTTVYCEQVRQFLSIYLSKANLYMVAVEQAITKKGMTHHHSNMVLTEIRGNILNFFLEEFGIKVIEVNNWAWKHSILPEGFRSPFEKGSKKFFLQHMPESPFAKYFEADMTDCWCIYQYIIKEKCKGYTLYCNKFEECSRNYNYVYVSESNALTINMREMQYNPRFSVVENLNYYVNRILGSFYMLVDMDKVDITTIYGKSVGFTSDDLDTNKVKVVVLK